MRKHAISAICVQELERWYNGAPQVEAAAANANPVDLLPVDKVVILKPKVELKASLLSSTAAPIACCTRVLLYSLAKHYMLLGRT